MKRVLLMFSFILITFFCFGQHTTFDLASFIPPPGWKKTMNEGVVMYHSPENKKGIFCLISIYKSISGSGELSTDFTNAWNELVANRLSVKDKPAIEKGEPENGWDNQTGSAAFSQQGSTATVLLTTMSGYGKAMSILVITNDQSYQQDMESFYNSVSLKKLSDEQKNQQPQQIAAVPGTLGDYVFTAPPGWAKEVSANEIVLRGPDKASVISILPMQTSSGDLEKDMNTIFWQVFPGWRADEWNPDNNVFTKGMSPSGWSYYKQELGIRKEEAGKVYQVYGFVMLAQLNSQVAVIAGSFPNGSSPLNEGQHVDWQLFFHSLDFKNFKGTGSNTLVKDILGEWLTGSSSGLSTYTFAANGRYANGNAFSTSHEISEYRVLEKTTSFAGDGSYTLKGNNLTLINARTHKPQTMMVRVFYRRNYKTSKWLRTIGLLEKSVVDGTLFELTMVFREEE